jgi:DNA-binding MarR family transcriptional regulator
LSNNVQAGTYTPEQLRELFHRKTLAGELHRSGVARALKISETEATAISHLARHGQLTPGELGNLLGLTSGGTTALLHRLEGAGHVKRHPHPSDKRSIILTVTPETLKRASEIYAPLVEEMDAIAIRYTDEERAMLGRFLSEIVTSAEGQAASLDSSTRAKQDPVVAAPEPGLWA